MGLWKCEACEARKDEIGHLRAELSAVHEQNTLLTKRLTELADPGIDRRLRMPRPIEMKTPIPVGGPTEGPGVPVGKPAGPQFPGYERPPVKTAFEVE